MRASLDEANFFGFMPWIVVQRVTLPLAVFFHFHSAVVCSQLFKEIYAAKKNLEITGKCSAGRRLTLFLLRTISIDNNNQAKPRDSSIEVEAEARKKDIGAIRFRRHTLANTSIPMELSEFRQNMKPK